MRSRTSLLLCAFLLAASVVPAPRGAGTPLLLGADVGVEAAAYGQGLETITEGRLRSWLRFLAATELEGRESGERGYDVAALYVASVLEWLGVAPRGDGETYYQSFDLVRRSWDLDGAVLKVRPRGGSEEKIPLKGQISLDASGPIRWTAPWVFVGAGRGGLTDSPDDLHAVSMSDRVLLVVPREDTDPPDIAEALLRGAHRLVVVSDGAVQRGAGLWWPEVATPPGEKPRYDRTDRLAPETCSIVYISTAVADRLLSPLGLAVAALRADGSGARPRELDRLEIALDVDLQETRRPTRNVIGFLEGSDPQIRHECVLIGAHLDHVGAHDGKVFHGADDDASGVSSTLGVASAFLSNPQRPRRSLLFLFFAAEEKGLIGSRYFVEHPVVPLDDMVLQIQLDMVGRDQQQGAESGAASGGTDDRGDVVHTVGAGRHSLELEPWVRSASEGFGLRVVKGDENLYPLSDHYFFGEEGIPVVFLFAGFHRDYHQPSDTVEKINFSKLLRITRLTYRLAYEVADRQRRLRSDRV